MVMFSVQVIKCANKRLEINDKTTQICVFYVVLSLLIRVMVTEEKKCNNTFLFLYRTKRFRYKHWYQTF